MILSYTYIIFNPDPSGFEFCTEESFNKRHRGIMNPDRGSWRSGTPDIWTSLKQVGFAIVPACSCLSNQQKPIEREIYKSPRLEVAFSGSSWRYRKIASGCRRSKMICSSIFVVSMRLSNTFPDFPGLGHVSAAAGRIRSFADLLKAAIGVLQDKEVVVWHCWNHWFQCDSNTQFHIKSGASLGRFGGFA